jgi:hypothetical protein
LKYIVNGHYRYSDDTGVGGLEVYHVSWSSMWHQSC